MVAKLVYYEGVHLDVGRKILLQSRERPKKKLIPHCSKKCIKPVERIIHISNRRYELLARDSAYDFSFSYIKRGFVEFQNKR